MTQLPPTPVRINVTEGDCVAVLKARSGPLFDAVVTDPPYELGFMGRGWDKSGVAFSVDTWRAIFDQMKPGAHLVAFSGTRTYHRMAVAIEDAGFEIRDQLAWAYGSGFPKSLDVSKAIDKAAGAEREVVAVNAAALRPNRINRGLVGAAGAGGFQADNGATITAPATSEAAQWDGWGTALKPAWEPICLARKPLDGTVAANVLAHGVGGLNIDACRVAFDGDTTESASSAGKGAGRDGANSNGTAYGSGLGGIVAQPHQLGRFPANLIHDGSDEIMGLFPDTISGGGPASGTPRTRGETYGEPTVSFSTPLGNNGGSAARFFYSAKAGPLDRLGSVHPTVKPVNVMRWLARLVCPPGGLLLDPFAGSGTTGIAALAERMNAELIDLMPAHVADITRKLSHLRGEGARVMEDHMRRKAARAAPSGLPLFDD